MIFEIELRFEALIEIKIGLWTVSVSTSLNNLLTPSIH